MKFFQDSDGNPSQMRLMCFLSLMASFAFGWLAVKMPDNQNSLYVFYGFLIGAFAPKAIQKFAERIK